MGIADGTSPWDANDTEGNGTFIEGHPPYLFARGSATGGTVTSGAKATFTDSTKNWTPNRWTGYSIKKVGATASYGSYIIGNGAHSITYPYIGSVGSPLWFNRGDTYEIHRVLVMMDQNGRGKGDRIIGRRNSRTGRASWPRQALEPCFSWNNVYTDGAVYGFRTHWDSRQQSEYRFLQPRRWIPGGRYSGTGFRNLQRSTQRRRLYRHVCLPASVNQPWVR